MELNGDVLSQLRRQAAESGKRIIFPEANDPRVLSAVEHLANQGWCRPVLVEAEGWTTVPAGVETVSMQDQQLVSQCGEQLFLNRQHRGLDRETADQAAREPLLFAALLVRTGFADGAVAGSIASTASVIRAGLYGIGTPEGRSLVSSFFLMQLADRAVTYADCGVVPDPNASELAEIAVNAAQNHATLTGQTPKVAMLSFSTKGSAEHPRIEKVREATRIARQLDPELQIDGELQFDAAFIPDVASRKAPDSDVAGYANVFIFPDLDSGNIAYKITERIGGAVALGPLVQGLRRPFMDLSRGCSESDIVDVAVVASVLAESLERLP